jgi:putative transposase
MKNAKNQNIGTQLLSLSCPEAKLAQVLTEAKADFNAFFASLKCHLVEFLLASEQESLAGPKHRPLPGWERWGAQPGSVYVAGERVKVKKPRLRKEGKEALLSVYQALADRERFSKEVLEKCLTGISCRDYGGTLDALLDDFGVTKSAVSRHLKFATTKQLKELKERSLESLEPFAIFLDGYHIGGKVFIVAAAIDIHGKKSVLGFWEGATENHQVCQELLDDLERRGLPLSEKMLYVTDGGKGIIKALRLRFGKALLHQRCTIHKDRNIQGHLPKKYRKEAHTRFRNAINCAGYQDAKGELKKLENWLESINPSAAESLRECAEELLTVHRLEVPPLLRKSLHSTNPIESMFSQASHRLGRIKRVRKGKMAQRWMATALLEAEQRFKTVKGYLSTDQVRSSMERVQAEEAAKAA